MSRRSGTIQPPAPTCRRRSSPIGNSSAPTPQPNRQSELFDLQLLGKLDAAGNVDVIDNRMLLEASVEEAVRAAKEIVLNAPVPGIYGFRLIRNGLEVFHWFIGQEDD